MNLKDRYEGYRTFRICFSNPTEELIERMDNGSLIESMQGINNEAMSETLEPLPSLIEKVLGYDTLSPKEHLEGQYTSIFVYPAYFAPYETVYLENTISAKPFLYGEVADIVKEEYLSAGFKIFSYGDMPDNISNELAFMEYLIGMEGRNSENAQKWRKMEVTFLSEHLLKWVPRLLEEMGTGIEYWRDYGSYLCEDRFCKERTQTNLVPGKLFERACDVRDCRVRISDYPDGIVLGLKFYYIMGKLLGHFLDKEAKLIDTELLRV
ncbi:nitrate reductase delta subunit [archaeon]|nr:nitrate reductase delta subunit [archaeon]